MKTDVLLPDIPYKHLKVGGFVYTVQYPWEESVPGLRAEIFHKFQRICIERGTIDNVKESMLHEAVHAVDADRQAGITEDQVRKMSLGLYAFIKDNRELVHWIMEEK